MSQKYLEALFMPVFLLLIDISPVLLFMLQWNYFWAIQNRIIDCIQFQLQQLIYPGQSASYLDVISHLNGSCGQMVSRRGAAG